MTQGLLVDPYQGGNLEEKASTLKLIQGAIRLSAHVVDKDETQLAGQLLGRLMSFKAPEIQALLAQSKQKQKPWLRPFTPSLTPPGTPLLRTLTGHSSYVKAVAITPDGKQVVSASDDSTLKVWDLHSGAERFTLRGHSDSVEAVVITPDGKQVVSASSLIHPQSLGFALWSRTIHPQWT
jgi:WD40 repeat protein